MGYAMAFESDCDVIPDEPAEKPLSQGKELPRGFFSGDSEKISADRWKIYIPTSPILLYLFGLCSIVDVCGSRW